MFLGSIKRLFLRSLIAAHLASLFCSWQQHHARGAFLWGLPQVWGSGRFPRSTPTLGPAAFLTFLFVQTSVLPSTPKLAAVPRSLGQRGTGGTQLSGRKARAFGEWHEPDEARVSRPVVRPAKAGMFSRRQTCRGKSQSPVVWIAEVMET